MVQIKFNVATAKEISSGCKLGSVRTKNGHNVRIVCWDAKGFFPVVGLIDLDETEIPQRYTEDGKVDFSNNVHTPIDLVLEIDGGEQ